MKSESTCSFEPKGSPQARETEPPECHCCALQHKTDEGVILTANKKCLRVVFCHDSADIAAHHGSQNSVTHTSKDERESDPKVRHHLGNSTMTTMTTLKLRDRQT